MVWTFIYYRFARLSLSHRRLHPRCDHKQQTTYTSWPARHCLALPGMPPRRLHRQLPAPAVPSPRRLLHLRRTRKWPCRLRVECMDREHGRFKPDAGPIARRLWPRRGYGAACCDESDYRGQGGMVLFLLYHGKPAVHRELQWKSEKYLHGQGRMCCHRTSFLPLGLLGLRRRRISPIPAQRLQLSRAGRLWGSRSRREGRRAPRPVRPSLRPRHLDPRLLPPWLRRS